MTGWTPLFQRIVCSSLWDQSDHVRLAWVTMLALATKDGEIPVKTAGALARMARIDLDKAADAIKVLSSPDETAPVDDLEQGRRIVSTPSGWRIVKWTQYRDMAKSAIAKERNAGYQAAHRGKLRSIAEDTEDCGTEEKDDRFEEFWRIYPRREAKPKAMSAWKKVKPAEVDLILKHVCDRAVSEDWTKENGKYVPLPASYLNARRWEDEATVAPSDPDAAPPKSDWKAYEAWAMKQALR